ncbi:MAG TPA: YceI family protein [Rhodanobacteraceae bacterium]
MSVLLVAVAAVAGAPVRAWRFDTATSQARFSVRKLWFAKARGRFPGLRGSLREVAGGGANAVAVDATVALATLVMAGTDDRARALGPDFFDAARYPQIHFHSAPFPFAELATGGALRGTLALHGEQRQVTLRLRPSACPRQPLACALRVRGTISRARFGMRHLRGLVSDKVEIALTIHVAAGQPAG